MEGKATGTRVVWVARFIARVLRRSARGLGNDHAAPPLACQASATRAVQGSSSPTWGQRRPGERAAAAARAGAMAPPLILVVVMRRMPPLLFPIIRRGPSAVWVRHRGLARPHHHKKPWAAGLTRLLGCRTHPPFGLQGSLAESGCSDENNPARATVNRKCERETNLVNKVVNRWPLWTNLVNKVVNRWPFG